jgi:hypothetical protein
MNGLGKLIFLCLLLFFGLSFPARAEPLRSVFTPYKPANYIDEEGNPGDFFIQIFREALEERLGIELEMKRDLQWMTSRIF